MPDSKNNFAFPLPKLPIRGMLISKNKGVPAWWPYAAMPGRLFCILDGRPPPKAQT